MNCKQNVWVALIRGINVGGKNIVPMKELRDLAGRIGAREVRSYVQSGNLIFQHEAQRSALSKALSNEIQKAYGISPNIMILTGSELQHALDQNPLPNSMAEPKSLHLFFMSRPPKNPDTDGMTALATKTERFALVDNVFYLHTPDGFARSKLAARAEKLLGEATTARNFNSVSKILKLANEVDI